MRVEQTLEEQRACPVCNGPARSVAEVVLDVPIHVTSQCNQCGMLFRSVRPSYQWTEYTWIAQPRDYDPESRLERLRYHRYQTIAETAARLGAGRSVIDFGCGPATGLRAFKDGGWKAVGLEPNTQLSEIATRINGIDMVADLDAVGRFDLVMIIHALEHIRDPVAVLQGLIGKMQPGGLLYVEVPDVETFVDWRDAFFSPHVLNFSESNLCYLASRVGLKPFYRVYPRTAPYGQVSLGLFFKAAEQSASPPKPADESTRLGWAHRYLVGLPAAAALPVRYRIPAVLDPKIFVPLSWIPQPDNGGFRMVEGSRWRTRARALVTSPFTTVKKGLRKLSDLTGLPDPAFTSLRGKPLA